MPDRNPNLPAFPTVDYYDEKPCGGTPGMTLRDYFAAKALPLVIEQEMSLRAAQINPKGFRYEAVARGAYLVADAMLAERVK